MLTIDHLDVAHGDVPVLRDLSFSVAGGEMVALIGPNGAGKTTLLRAISGVARVRRGTVTFDGRDLTNRQPHQISRAGISHVPEGRGILAELTVLENLRLGAYRRHMSAGGFDRVFALFPVLAGRRAQQAGMLSGGEQQMLAIGRSLLASPRILLIDELSLGLAPKIARELLDVLRGLVAEGLGVLLVEQNVHETLRVADRVVVTGQWHHRPRRCRRGSEPRRCHEPLCRRRDMNQKVFASFSKKKRLPFLR